MISSNFYSASATSALRSLQSAAKEMETAQTRISTGFKVNSASDDAVLWNLATKVRSDIKQTDALQDGIKTTLGNAKVASATLDSVGAILQQLKAKVAAAKAGADATTTQADILSLQNQIKSVVAQGKFSGDSWLDGSIGTASVTTGSSGATVFSDSADLSAAVLISKTGATGILNKNGVALTGTAGKTILDMDISQIDGTSGKTYANALTDIETAITAVTTASTTIASFSKRLDMQSSFLSTISSVKSSALGSLINADLNEESAKVNALQTSQALATSMISLANSSRQNILRLFQ